MQVQLRPYDTQDTNALLDLFRETIHTVNGKDYPPEILIALAPPFPDIKRKQARFKSNKTVVAHLDGKIVGFGNLDNDLSRIGMLYVHKDHLNQNIGSRLLKSLEKKLIKRGVSSAIVEVSITGKSFFERKGFHVIKENKKMLNGIEFLTYDMEKDITSKENTMAKEIKEKTDEKEKVKRLRPFNWRDLFINKFFDLLMVIIGVSIAFYLENLRQEANHKSIETFYLESMLGDLRKDKEEMVEVITSLQEDRVVLENYITFAKQVDYPADSLGKVVLKVLSLETFSENDNTYEMLKSNNGLTEFSDTGIRAKTTDYYSRYNSIRRFEQVYTNVLFSLNSYFNQSIDFAERKVLDPSVALKTETKNWLLMADTQLNTGLEDYAEAMEKLDILIKAVEDRLLIL